MFYKYVYVYLCVSTHLYICSSSYFYCNLCLTYLLQTLCLLVNEILRGSSSTVSRSKSLRISSCELQSSNDRYIAICVANDEMQSIPAVEMISLVSSLRVKLDEGTGIDRGRDSKSGIGESSLDLQEVARNISGPIYIWRGVIERKRIDIYRVLPPSDHTIRPVTSALDSHQLLRPSVLHMYRGYPARLAHTIADVDVDVDVTCASVNALGGGAGLSSIILMILTGR